MAVLGVIVAIWLFFGVLRHLREMRGPTFVGGGEVALDPRETSRRHRDWAREMRRWNRVRRTCGDAAAGPAPVLRDVIARGARHGIGAEVGFYSHLLTYLGVTALLAFINVLAGGGAWFLWPAAGWGFGLFAHWMGVFGRRAVVARYVEPAVEREVQREKVVLQTEKQDDIGALSSTIAHEIRNPIAAAKSLVQQIGEDPQSMANSEYAKVAVDELDRVERRIAHLLRYAREEDYAMTPVNLATVVDGALTQLRAKLDAAHVQALRHYIAGPVVRADADKLQGVFANVVTNAVDALAPRAEPRQIDLFIENGGGAVVVRIRDNGPGIPTDQLDRIFDPFFTTKADGTGLGMAIARKTVEAHGGTLAAASLADGGAEFVVTLPLSG